MIVINLIISFFLVGCIIELGNRGGLSWLVAFMLLICLWVNFWLFLGVFVIIGILLR